MRNVFGLLVCSALLLTGAGCFRSNEPTVQPEALKGDSTDAIAELPFKSIDEYIPSDQSPQDVKESLPEAVQEEVVKAGEYASQSKNVIVSSLVKNQELGSPFIILGRARAFENVINWRVRDEDGKILLSGSAMTNAQEMGLYGSFRIRSLLSEIPSTDTGTVQVFTMSPKDGTDQDMVEVPIRFSKERLAVSVYFSNVLKDPNVMNCEITYPVVRRIVKTQNTAEASLIELLKGPTVQEQSSGARTTIVPGTVLRSVRIQDGVAIADFSNELVYGLGGSCRVQALISQITQTLKQFDGVNSVKIYVEGEDAELKLQP